MLSVPLESRQITLVLRPGEPSCSVEIEPWPWVRLSYVLMTLELHSAALRNPALDRCVGELLQLELREGSDRVLANSVLGVQVPFPPPYAGRASDPRQGISMAEPEPVIGSGALTLVVTRHGGGDFAWAADVDLSIVLLGFTDGRAGRSSLASEA